MTAASLSFNGLTVGYGARAVVRNVDFSMAPGEFVGLVGPNGAGKSTLLRAVTGGADVLAGDIVSDGRSLVAMDERARARLVGVVPQTPAPLFAFTARAFVEMGRHPHLGRLEEPGLADAAVVADVMQRTDTARLADELVNELSGGDLQRLTLAQALAQRPRVLLLDEPTSHLDLNHALQVLDLVRSLADEGMTVLGVFHDLEIAARYADRIAIVASERVEPPRPPALAIDADTVSRVFGVRAVVGTDPVTGSVAVTPVLRGEDLAEGPVRARVGLVCGSGSGAVVMRRLALGGFGVFAGALNRGDVDYAVAEALHADMVGLPPFSPIGPAEEEAACARYRECDATVVCATPFGGSNVPNLRAAVHAGRPLVFVGGIGEDRDFTGGEAARLWAHAMAEGAVRVQTEAEALHEVERVTRVEGP